VSDLVASEKADAHVAFSKDFLAIGCRTELKLWGVEIRSVVRRLEVHDSPIRAVDFSSDGRMLVTCDSTDLKVWEVEKLLAP
jgi:WD40 repeat protein